MTVSSRILVVDQCDPAFRALERLTAVTALYICRVSAAVHEQNHLLAFFQCRLHLSRERGAEDTSVAAPELSLHVHYPDFRKQCFIKALFQLDELVYTFTRSLV